MENKQKVNPYIPNFADSRVGDKCWMVGVGNTSIHQKFEKYLVVLNKTDIKSLFQQYVYSMTGDLLEISGKLMSIAKPIIPVPIMLFHSIEEYMCYCAWEQRNNPEYANEDNERSEIDIFSAARIMLDGGVVTPIGAPGALYYLNKWGKVRASFQYKPNATKYSHKTIVDFIEEYIYTDIKWLNVNL